MTGNRALQTLPVLLAAISLAALPAFALPDAVLARIDASGKDFRAGDVVPIHVEIRNAGDDPLPPVLVSLAIDYQTYAEWTSPRTLAPGEATTWDLTWPATRGGHIFLATVDPLNTLAESDESNNSTFVNIGVGEARPVFPWAAAATGGASFVFGALIAIVLRRYLARPAG